MGIIDLNKRQDKTPQYAKPAWAEGHLATSDSDYVLDFGSGKVALTRGDGTQVFNYPYNDKKTKINLVDASEKGKKDKWVYPGKFQEEIKQRVIEDLRTRGNTKRKRQDPERFFKRGAVSARFTGKFRYRIANFDAFFKSNCEAMRKNYITDVALLDMESEGRMGSMHTLTISLPYYAKAERPVERYIIVELGNGSHQGAVYEPIRRRRRRLGSRAALEDLLELCRAHGYQG